MEGFVIFDHEPSFTEARRQLRAWLTTGKLRYREDILDGLDACPDAIAGLYRGDNRGKRLIRLDTDPPTGSGGLLTDKQPSGRPARSPGSVGSDDAASSCQ
jgi:hypothetical protein